MAWVNETEPANREAGFAVSTAFEGYGGTFPDSKVHTFNSAGLADIFDPAFLPGDDVCSFVISTNGTSWWAQERWTSLTVDLGGPRNITKINVRYGSGSFGNLTGHANTHGKDTYFMSRYRLQASHNNSTWVTLLNFSILRYQHTTTPNTEWLTNGTESYRYYRIISPVGGLSRIEGPKINGFDFYSGTFVDEEDEQSWDLTWHTDAIAAVSSPSFTAGYPPENIFDGDPATYFLMSTCNTYVQIDLGQSYVVNYVRIRAWTLALSGTSVTTHTNKYFDLYGSENGISFTKLNPVVVGGFSAVVHDYFVTLNMRGVQGIPYRYYRIYPVGGENETQITDIHLGHIGRWAVFAENLPPRYISEAVTHPMLIASVKPRTCEGVTGANTGGLEGDEFWMNRITREPLEAEGFCGAIGGEYDWEEEDFIIEREISVEAYISPVADFSMLARDINGLAGFGRQCNGAITIRHSLEGSTGEFALMDDGVRSRYEMEGHCGTRAEMTRQLSMAGFAQPGNNSRATLFREPLTMSALAGAIAGGTRTVEVSATALQHLFASLASSLPARTALATAVVNGMAWGDCTLHSRQMDAEAVVSLFSHGSQTVPARWAEGQAMTGGLTSADLMLPTYTVEAQGVVDALATAHFLRTNYRMTGKTKGSRFDTYLLKYEAPL